MESTSFSPPYCPNSGCEHHHRVGILSRKFYVCKGWENRKIPAHRIQRYRCQSCKRDFTKRSFSLNYRLHKTGHVSARVFWGVVHNRSNRSIARELNLSECLVRLRILRLSQMALRHHANFMEKVTINEPIAYDGLECFARSQYEPNNINQAVGTKSLFCYLFNFAPLNRKGRCSDRQKKFLFKLEQKEGRFDPRAIRKSSAEMFSQLLRLKNPELSKLTLHTDEHFQYHRALNWDLHKVERSKIEHVSVSSKATRNYKNILFAVNHLDLLIRRYVAAYSRETICFAKKHSRMIHKYVLFVCYKNYMKPRFTKRHKTDPTAHIHSPAMHVGLCSKILGFSDFFGERKPTSKSISQYPQWQALLEDKVHYSRHHRYLKKAA